MAEIKIRFDLTFSRRFMTAAAAATFMLCAVPELESESVTLSTYYPAPSGVYTNMITTGNTYLARDGGANVNKVGLGLTNPTVKLDVAQNEAMKVGNAYLSSGGDYVHLANNEWYNGGAWVGNGSAGALLQIAGQSFNFYTHTAGGSPAHTQTMSLDPSGNLNVVAQLSANQVNTAGAILSRQGQVFGTCNTISHTYPTPSGGTWSLCAAGQYVTNIDGFYAKEYMIQVVPNASTNPEITARCCPCPVGGCPL